MIRIVLGSLFYIHIGHLQEMSSWGIVGGWGKNRKLGRGNTNLWFGGFHWLPVRVHSGVGISLSPQWWRPQVGWGWNPDRRDAEIAQ